MNDRIRRRADLHTHTTASDGLHRPADVVRMAREAGLAAVAITDHDTVAGIPDALEAGAEYGVAVVAGVEISTSANGKDIHVLGYGVPHNDSLLLQRLLSQRQVRNRRNEAILARLSELGAAVTPEELEAIAGKSRRGEGAVGRPHIAQALVDKGHAADIRDAFDRYLGEGKPAYVNPVRVGPLEAVQWIQEAGGTAIVAHPGLYGDDGLVGEILDGGADGLEAYHSDHDAATARKYAELAAGRGVIATGGSDFHGARQGVVFHGAVGSVTVDAAIVDLFRSRQ